MSTSFHFLRKPFTSARTTIAGGHTTLSLWVNGAKTGDLVLRNEEVRDVLLAISRQGEDDISCAVITNSMGVRLNHDHIDQNASLVSECGDLTCLSELLRKESKT
jgi:hypothetical protein